MKLLIFLLSLFCLAGCATKGPVFSKHHQTKPEYSRIYFYRPSEGWYDIAVNSIYIDDKVVRNVRPGQVTYIDIDSAPHTLRIKNGDTLREVTGQIQAQQPSLDFIRLKRISAKDEYKEFGNLKDMFFASGTPKMKSEGGVIKTLFFDIVPKETAQGEMENLEVVF